MDKGGHTQGQTETTSSVLLSVGGSTAHPLRLGPSRELLPTAVIFLGNFRLLLGKDHLDMARATPVRIDTAVRAEGPTPVLLRSVHLDVLDDERLGVEALHLRIRLGILEEPEHMLAALLRPAALTGGASFVFRLRGSAHATAELPEWNAPLPCHHRLEVLLCLHERHALDRCCNGMRVFEVDYTYTTPPRQHTHTHTHTHTRSSSSTYKT